MELGVAYGGYFVNADEFIQKMNQTDVPTPYEKEKEKQPVAQTFAVSSSQGDAHMTTHKPSSDTIELTKQEFGLLCFCSGLSVAMIFMLLLQQRPSKPTSHLAIG